METNTPPECECGNGSMLLRKAGEFSTRPGKYYYIYPAFLKHPKKFYWYDEYHGNIFTSTKQTCPPSGGDSGTVTGKSFVRRNVTTGTTSSSSSPSMKDTSTYNMERAYSANTFTDTSTATIGNTSVLRSEALQRLSISTEAICCYFGFICLFICLLLVLVMLIVIRM